MKSEREYVYGVHPVVALLQAGRRRIEKILLAPRHHHRGAQQIVALASHQHIPVTSVTQAELRQVLGHDQHQGVAALVAPLAYRPFNDVTALLQQRPGPHTLLALDGVTDVGNFATLIRSAVAFGVDAILLPKHHSVGLTSVVAKRSAGAAERVTFVQVGNMIRALEALQRLGCWLYGAEAQGETAIATVAWPERTVVVMGAEGRGIRRLVRERCDHLVRIPMREGTNSLNVAVAGAIILSHVWGYHQMRGGPCGMS
jgi:23S rRNA (guanosine2251-2'-O)-methyltransferase